jgi:hypothetical protein
VALPAGPGAGICPNAADPEQATANPNTDFASTFRNTGTTTAPSPQKTPQPTIARRNTHNKYNQTFSYIGKSRPEPAANSLGFSNCAVPCHGISVGFHYSMDQNQARRIVSARRERKKTGHLGLFIYSPDRQSGKIPKGGKAVAMANSFATAPILVRMMVQAVVFGERCCFPGQNLASHVTSNINSS